VFRRLFDLVQQLRAHLPQGTVRVRLTILYSSVFLPGGAALLVITYQLVEHSTDRAVYTTRGPRFPADGHTFHRSIAGLSPPAAQLNAQIARVQAGDLHQLLIKSGIALTIMAVVAIVLGYLLAGRVLRPLRRITTTAQGISAGNLHARLAMTGPDDELKQLGDTFDELLSRLEASFSSQRQLVANASHELRSPLTRLRLLAEVAATDDEATVASLQRALQRVTAAAVQEEQLLEALLALAQSQSELGLRQLFDLSSVVDDVVSATRQGPGGTDVHLESHTGPAPMVGDPRLVERLVGNLIDNAMRYNVAGGQVRVVSGAIDGSVLLDVCNDGPLVPPTELDRLFRPFQRLESGRGHHVVGHGLGLSIVEAIATAHRATVMVLARPEGGLRIQVRFPLSNTETARDERPLLLTIAPTAASGG